MLNLRWASAAHSSTCSPASSGPRCVRMSRIAKTRAAARSSRRSTATRPAIPHIDECLYLDRQTLRRGGDSCVPLEPRHAAVAKAESLADLIEHDPDWCLFLIEQRGDDRDAASAIKGGDESGDSEWQRCVNPVLQQRRGVSLPVLARDPALQRIQLAAVDGGQPWTGTKGVQYEHLARRACRPRAPRTVQPQLHGGELEAEIHLMVAFALQVVDDHPVATFHIQHAPPMA